MDLNEKIVRNLPEDLMMAENMIIKSFFRVLQDLSIESGNKNEHIDKFIDVLSLHQVFSEENGLEMEYPKLGINKKENIMLITHFFKTRSRFVEKKVQEILREKSLADKKSIYKSLISHKFIFSLKDDEVEKLRQIIEELIEIVELIRTEEIHIDHVDRLFKRLKSIKSQINIRMATLDECWGLIGDAGIAVGKFSSDAKPIVERIRDILNMVWQIQARSENLGAATPKMMLNFQEPTKVVVETSESDDTDENHESAENSDSAEENEPRELTEEEEFNEFDEIRNLSKKIEMGELSDMEE